MKCRIVYAGLFALAMAASPAFADVVFTDNSFNLADYSASPTFLSDASTSAVYSSVPGTLTFTSTFIANSFTAQGIVNNGFLIDPSIQGVITSINASVSKNLTVTGPEVTGTFGNTFRPTIEQNGTFYVAAIPGASMTTIPFTTGFNVLSQAGLLATDFSAFNFGTGSFDSSSHPDFGGNAMLFGLTQISTDGDAPGQIIADYQNLSIGVHGVTPVPEPETYAMLMAGLGILGWTARKRKRGQTD